MLILSKDPLPGHTKGHHPPGKEEQEEEYIDQLSREEDRRAESGLCQGGSATPLTTEKAEGPQEPKAASIIRSPIFKHGHHHPWVSGHPLMDASLLAGPQASSAAETF